MRILVVVLIGVFLSACGGGGDFDPNNSKRVQEREDALEAFLKAERNRKTIPLITKGSLPERVFGYLHRAESAKEFLRQKVELDSIDVARFSAPISMAYASEDPAETIANLLARIELNLELAIETAERGYNLDLIDATLEEVQGAGDLMINDLESVKEKTVSEDRKKIQETIDHLHQIFQNIEFSLIEIQEGIKNNEIFSDLDVPTNVEEFLQSGKTIKSVPLEVNRKKLGEAKIKRYRANLVAFEKELKSIGMDSESIRTILSRQERYLKKGMKLVFGVASLEKIWDWVRTINREYWVLKSMIKKGIVEVDMLGSMVGQIKKKQIKILKEQLEVRDETLNAWAKLREKEEEPWKWQREFYQARVKAQDLTNKKRYVVLMILQPESADKFWRYFEKYAEMRDKNFEKMQQFKKSEAVFLDYLKFQIATSQMSKEEALEQVYGRERNM